jgi:hypothetical protein
MFQLVELFSNGSQQLFPRQGVHPASYSHLPQLTLRHLQSLLGQAAVMCHLADASFLLCVSSFWLSFLLFTKPFLLLRYLLQSSTCHLLFSESSDKALDPRLAHLSGI